MGIFLLLLNRTAEARQTQDTASKIEPFVHGTHTELPQQLYGTGFFNIYTDNVIILFIYSKFNNPQWNSVFAVFSKNKL